MSRLRVLLGPRWLAVHAGVLLAVALFVQLGRWQLATYDDRNVERSPAGGEPVPIAQVTAPGQPLTTDAAGAYVRLTGRYDADEQLFVPGRTNAGRTGLEVVTPLVTATGAVALVDRGWVPSVEPGAAGDADGFEPPGGQVTVTGTLQRNEAEEASAVDPLAPLPDGQVAYIATGSLLSRLPYDPARLYDGFVVLAEQQPSPANAPVPAERPGTGGGNGAWRNLAYALQWWLFAGAAVAFWGSLIRRDAGNRRAQPAATAHE